jgi:uncharacterized RDD family membrane protein YckC
VNAVPTVDAESTLSPTRARVAGLQGRRAGIVSRVTANAIDLGVVFVCYFLVLVAWAAVGYLATSNPFRIPDPPPWLHALALVGVQILYLASGWSGSTRTVGKELMGLRVVTSRGDLLTYRRGLVRAVVCTFIGEPLLLWAAISRRNAALYDMFLHTAVVYDWRSPAQVRAAAARDPHAGTLH